MSRQSRYHFAILDNCIVERIVAKMNWVQIYSMFVCWKKKTTFVTTIVCAAAELTCLCLFFRRCCAQQFIHQGSCFGMYCICNEERLKSIISAMATNKAKWKMENCFMKSLISLWKSWNHDLNLSYFFPAHIKCLQSFFNNVLASQRTICFILQTSPQWKVIVPKHRQRFPFLFVLFAGWAGLANSCPARKHWWVAFWAQSGGTDR